MATYLYIATAIGLFVAAQTDGNWKIVRLRAWICRRET